MTKNLRWFLILLLLAAALASTWRSQEAAHPPASTPTPVSTLALTGPTPVSTPTLMEPTPASKIRVSTSPKIHPREPYLEIFVRSGKLMMTLTNNSKKPVKVFLFGSEPESSLTLQDISVSTRDTVGSHWPGGVCGTGMASGHGVLNPGQSVTTPICEPYFQGDDVVDTRRQIFAAVNVVEPGRYSREIESNRLPLSEVPFHRW